MSSPNFENIEQWFFEYTEGNLSSQQEAQLLGFISENPELIPELHSWRDAKVSQVKEEVPAVLIASLVKSTPFYLNPLSIASFASVLLIAFWFLFNQITVEPSYIAEAIDIDIIYAEQNSNQISTYTNYNVTEQEDLEIELVDVEKHRTLYSSYSNHSDALLAGQLDRNLEANNATFSSFLDDEKENNILDHSLLVEGDVDALPINEINEIINQQNSTISTKKVSNTSSKTQLFFSNLIRKVDKMTSKQIALQSTKNPYYQIPMLTGLNANPAMVGSGVGNQLQLTSRFQWLGESNVQLLNTLSWDSYISELRGGFGLVMNYENYSGGDLSNYSAKIIYSPKFVINKDLSIEPMLSFKMGSINLNPGASIIGTDIEFRRQEVIPLFVNENVNGSQLWYRDVGLGAMLNTKWFYASVNLDNLGRHNNNFYSSDISQSYREAIHYIAVVGTEYQPIAKPIKINAYALYQNYGPLNEIWLGGNLQYNWFTFGAGVSSSADIAGSVGFIVRRFAFNYNIDYTKSLLVNKQLLSHQVSMKVLLKPFSVGRNRYLSF